MKQESRKQEDMKQENTEQTAQTTEETVGTKEMPAASEDDTIIAEAAEGACSGECRAECREGCRGESGADTVPALKAANQSLTAKLAESEDKYLRMIAEYDNYRKRAQKEREGVYADAYCDVLKEILPILDNLERAAQFADNDQVSAGVQMTLRQCKEIFAKLGVTEIETKVFDPNLHNAVMHVEDEEHGEGEITEVFQKGYRKDDKILRYAMVKVAN